MENKRGQLAIFVIIAIVIVGILLFLFLLNRSGPIGGNTTPFSPQSYLQGCFENDLRAQMAGLARQGGYANPEGYLLFNGDKIKYLCYTSENYKTCVIQQPLILEHFESELNAKVDTEIQQCAQNLKNEYQNRGYTVTLGKVEDTVTLSPDKLTVAIDSPMTIQKGSDTRNFNGFNVEMKSEMYNLLMITVSIIDYEATYGDSETTLYLQYYPDLKIEKTRLEEGSKVYRLTNVVTNETFTFASRSLVWPPGYGL